MSKYSKYPSYKDSGVEWLGEIPDGWSLMRYKYILKIFQGNAFKSSDYVDYSDVINIRMGNIKKGGKLDLSHNLKYLPEHYSLQYKDYKLSDKDIIIAMTDMSPSLEFLAVPATLENLDTNKVYLLNQRVGKLNFKGNTDSDYIKFTLLSYELREYFKSSGLGTVQANMSNDDLYNAFLALPPLQEQKAIATYLDRATQKIDTLIAKQSSLIALLKEKRQALISHAVTKGVENEELRMKNEEFKDSGVAWLGEIPEGWNISLLKRYCKITDGSHHSPKIQDSGYPFISVTDVGHNTIDFENCKKISDVDFHRLIREGCKPGVGDVLLTKDGTIGRAAIVKREYPMFVILSSLGLLTPNSKLHNHYLYYYLISGYNIDQMNSMIHGSALKRMTISKIENLFISFPIYVEQKKIATYLDQKTQKIDTLISKATQAITLLKEKRTALISAVVTGKVKVNGEAREGALGQDVRDFKESSDAF